VLQCSGLAPRVNPTWKSDTLAREGRGADVSSTVDGVERVAIVIDLPAAKRLAFGVVRGQAAMTLVAALVGWALGGLHVGSSAALGGGIGTLASLGMALLAFRGTAGSSPGRILGAFYAGELVKVALAIVSFILVLKLTGAAPLPMFAAYMATFVVYWIVLARMALPALSAARRARA
jgi:ATP synthase protein I